MSIHAHQGRVVLTGLVLAEEAHRLLSAVASVRGVNEVQDHLERLALASTPEQAARPVPVRVASGAAAAGLTLYAARRGGVFGALLGGLGLALLVVGAAGAEPTPDRAAR